MTDLATSIEGILDAIETALTDALAAGQALDGVKSIVRGDIVRPMPAMPAVWIVPDAATFEQAEYGTERWTLPITFAALVKGTDPKAAARDSQTFAAKARAVALATRPAGVDVIDVLSQSFDPQAHSSEANRSLFWTEATVVVSFDCDS